MYYYSKIYQFENLQDLHDFRADAYPIVKGSEKDITLSSEEEVLQVHVIIEDADDKVVVDLEEIANIHSGEISDKIVLLWSSDWNDTCLQEWENIKK